MYHLAFTQYAFYSPVLHRNIHLGFALVLVFLATMRRRPKAWPVLLSLVLLSLVCVVYVTYYFDQLEARLGIVTTSDLIIGILIVVIAFEATREAFGLTLPIIGAIFVLYIAFGQYLPRPFWHAPISLSQVVSNYSIGFEGVYGSLLGISAQYIYLFVLFGAVLGLSGATGFFIEVGKLAGRVFSGGGAMTAVISSALVGMCTGSVTANITLTGAFTIPTMKKMGYTAEEAGAIENVASTGGQIMPPVMGTTAFLMANFLGISYWRVCVMAIIPALLYFLCAGLYVQFTAAKRGLRPLAREKVNRKKMLMGSVLFFSPLLTVTYLLATGLSAGFAAFWAIIVLLGLALILGITKQVPLASPSVWVREITDGSTTAAQIAVSVALLGIVESSVVMTGIGIRFPSVVEALSGGNAAVVFFLNP